MEKKKSNFLILKRYLEIKYKNNEEVLTIEELVKKYQETKDEDIFERIVYKNIERIGKLINRFEQNYSLSEDELLSICLETLYKTCCNYNGETEFTKYMTVGIINVTSSMRKKQLGGGSSHLGKIIYDYNVISSNDVNPSQEELDDEEIYRIINEMIELGIIQENSLTADSLLRKLLVTNMRRVNIFNISEDNAFKEDEATAQTMYIVDNFERMTKGLTERELEVINIHFGLSGDKPLSLNEIAEIYEVTNSAVSQILQNAIRKMRGKIFNDQTFEGRMRRKIVAEKDAKRWSIPKYRII